MAKRAASAIQGVYLITNAVNGNRYVGSSRDIVLRWTQHCRALNCGHHHNRHLQGAWNIYGADAFTVEVVETVLDWSDLFRAEQWYLDSVRPEYNIALDARAPTRGRKMSAAAHAKLIANLTGRVLSDETRAKIARAHRGLRASAETKAKIGAASRNRSPETLDKLRRAATGKKRAVRWVPSEATRAIWRQQRSGRTMTGEARSNMAEAQRARRAREHASRSASVSTP
jgi:group I intron endonuclease